MKNFDEIFDENFTSVDDMNNLLLVLKREGATIMDTVKVIKIKTGLPLKMVDNLVLNSDTWKDSKTNLTEFREGFLSKLDVPE